MEDKKSSIADKKVARSSLFATVKAVLWSFLGIRKRADYEQDAVQLNPVHVIIVGIFCALVFVLGLLLVVQWVVA